MLQFIKKFIPSWIRTGTMATFVTSLLTLALVSPAFALSTVSIGNGANKPVGSYDNAQILANEMVVTSVIIQASTSITIVDPIDLSTSGLGTPQFDLTLSAPVCNISNSVNMAAQGNLILNCGTVNINAPVTSGGALIAPSRFTGSATQMNVQGPSADLQQAINASSQTSTPVISVAAGQYKENITLNHPLTLTGNDGTNPVGADPNAPTINGTQPGGNVITVTANNVKVDGLHVDAAVNGGSSAPSVTGIMAQNVDSFTATHNTLTGFGGSGINTTGSTNVVFSDNIPADQTISFTSSAPTNATVGGPTYTPTATATSSLPVAITVDSSAASVCAIDNSGNVSFQATGTCVLDANQGGNTTYNAAPQVQQSFAVSVAPQTVSFSSTAPTSATVGGPTYTPTASATSGLPVAITVDPSSSSVCSINSGVVSFQNAGSCTLDANQSGNAAYSAAPQVQQSFTVNQAAQTVTFTSSAPTNAIVNGPTYSPTASATSGLPVAITVDPASTNICSLSGGAVSFLTAGTCTLDANQAGNANYTAAPQVQQSFTVSPAGQTVTFTSTAPTNAVVGGPTYTPAASATSGLPVAITVDSSSSSVCSINGSGNVSFQTAGNCILDANQGGNPQYNAAPQTQQSFTVSHVSQTVSFTSTAPTNATVGGPTYTPTASATSGLPVTITVDSVSSNVCSINGGAVSFQHAGTCTLDANQSGNGAYGAATQVQQSFAVNQAPVFTANTPPSNATVGQSYAYTFAATGTPAPTYSLAAGAPSWLSINPTTGALTGTPPSGTTSFTYSVVATNSTGSTTTGPFTVSVSPAPTTSTKADISVSSHCTSGAHFGATGTCTVTVKNNGPATAKNVSVTASISEPFSFFLVGAYKTWTVASLTSGASTAFTISAPEPIFSGTAYLNAQAFSSNPDPNIFNNYSSAAF